MAYKGADPAYNKAADDEPIFVLRSQDKLAPEIVRAWAAAAQRAGSPSEKVQEAIDCASAMEAWQKENSCKVPD